MEVVANKASVFVLSECNLTSSRLLLLLELCLNLDVLNRF